MAHFKNVRVRAIYWSLGGRKFGYWWQDKTFTTFTDDNGNKTYYINGEEVTKEEGNAEYLRIKKANAEYQQTKDCAEFVKRQKNTYYKITSDYRKRNEECPFSRDTYTLSPAETYIQTVEEYDTSYEELIEKYRKSIDPYTMYIDNYRQQLQAEAANEELEKKIKWLEQLIKERK